MPTTDSPQTDPSQKSLEEARPSEEQLREAYRILFNYEWREHGPKISNWYGRNSPESERFRRIALALDKARQEGKQAGYDAGIAYGFGLNAPPSRPQP